MSVLKLKPSCKDYLWGGHRLVEEYGKEYDGEILAETWELSCHPDGPSTIVNGAYAGKTLEEYIEAEGKEVLGTNCRRFRDFPILANLLMQSRIYLSRFIRITDMPLKMKGNMEKQKCGM